MGPQSPVLSPTIASLDVENLWIPAANVTHGSWITRLVSTLITSGAVNDEVLVLLKPVCETKVCCVVGVGGMGEVCVCVCVCVCECVWLARCVWLGWNVYG